MLVCAGCIQEGDEAQRFACASSDACSRCGSVPETFEPGSCAAAVAPWLFRVHVVAPSTLDLSASTEARS